MAQQIVIFDMDGTLIDSSLDITSSVNYVRATLGLEPLSVKRVVEAINAQERNLALIFYEKEHYEQKERSLFEEHYFNECIKNVSLYEGVYEMLNQLKQNGIVCSVATNAPQKYALRMLEHLKVSHFFDCIYGACTFQPKPHPEMLHAILEFYKFDAKNHPKPIMVGDNQKDVLAAENAKIFGFHIAWGFAQETDRNSIENPKKLLEYFNIY